MGDIEEQAAELGHTDLEAWTESGKDPDKWRTAEEFMEYGNQSARFVRAKLKKEFDLSLAESNRDFENRLAGLEQTTSAAIDAKNQEDATRRQQQITQWEAHKNKAAADDNLEEFNKAISAIEALKGQVPEPTVQQARQSSASSGFHNKYMPLISTNDEVKRFTDDASATIRRDNPNLPEDEYFKELSTRLEERWGDDFPQFFGKRKKRAPAVDTSDGDAGSSGSKKYSDLPAEAKAACDQFVERGLFKSKQEYIDKYFAE